jgi:flagellar export protein FliJ
LAQFVFNLETLLRHREEVEQREREALFHLNYKYQMELRARESLDNKFQETMKELALKRAENAPHSELDWFYLYLDRLTLEIEECEKRLAQLRSEVEAQKEIVIDASKKRKTLSAMKAKKQKEFLAALDKKEQKEVDELVVARYSVKESQYRQATESSKPITAAKN